MTNQPETENILRTQLILRNGLFLNQQNNKPFTGMAIEPVCNENNPFDLSKAITRIEYKNGKRHGFYKYFHKNGQLMFRGSYTNGILQGAFEEFYENGQLQETGDYKNGKQHGSWEFFEEDGNLVSRTIFKNDQVVEFELGGDKPFFWLMPHHFRSIESTRGFNKP